MQVAELLKSVEPLEGHFLQSLQFRIPVSYAVNGDVNRFISVRQQSEAQLGESEALQEFLKGRNPIDIWPSTIIYLYLSKVKGDTAVLAPYISGPRSDEVRNALVELERRWNSVTSYYSGFPANYIPASDARVGGHLSQIYEFVNAVLARVPISYFEIVSTQSGISNRYDPTTAAAAAGAGIVRTHFTVTNATYTAKLNLPPEIINDKYRLFDQILVSYDLPLVSITSRTSGAGGAGGGAGGEARKIYKVYNKRKLKTLPMHTDDKNTRHADTITFTLGSSQRTKDVDDATTEETCASGYITAYIQGDELSMKVPVRSVKRIKSDAHCLFEKVISSMPALISSINLGITSINQTAVSGIYYLIGTPLIDFPTFATLIQRTPEFSYFMSLSEYAHSLYEKNQMKLIVRHPLESINGKIKHPLFNVNVTQYQTDKNDVEVLYLEQGFIELPPKTIYLALEVNSAPSIASLDRFIYSFEAAVVCCAFGDQLGISPDKTGAYYTNLFSNSAQHTAEDSIAAQKKKVARATISALKDEVPELFNLAGFTRHCKPKRQPAILKSQNDINEIVAKGVLVTSSEGTTYSRIIQYPNVMIEPELAPYARYYTCRHPDFPVPGLIRSSLSKRSRFKFFPCCFGQPTEQDVGSHYYRYLNGLGSEKDRNVTDILKKALKPYQRGDVPDPIANLFRPFTLQIGELKRYCVNTDIDSFLHALLYAVDERYRTIFHSGATVENHELLDDIVQKLKDRFPEVNPGLLKQELYDMSEGDICALLSDPELVVTSELYYHLLEELLGINIFVFTGDDNTSSLEIPVSTIFSRRPAVLRSTVLLRKVLLAKTADIYQYELIGKVPDPINMLPNSNNPLDPIFNETTLIELMFEVCNATSDTYLVEKGENYRIRKPLDAIVDLRQFFAQNVMYQYVDASGKLRAFIVKSSVPGGILAESVSIIFAPTQPMNKPTVERLPTCSYATAIATLGFEVTAQSNFSPGLWFKVADQPYALYVPLDNATSEMAHLPRVGINPLYNAVYQPSATSSMTDLRKMAHLLWQIIRWAFTVYLLSQIREAAEAKTIYDEDVALNTFIERYLRVDSTEYQFHSRSRLLPKVNEMQQVLAWLSINYPSFATTQYIKLQDIDLANKISQRLEKYIQHIIASTDIPTEFLGLYQTASDFTPQTNMLVMMNPESLRAWFDSYEKFALPAYPIETRLNLLMGFRHDLFIYANPEADVSRLYLVQTVARHEGQSSVAGALLVAAVWKAEKKNIGGLWGVSEVDGIATIMKGYGLTGYIVYGIGATTGNLAYRRSVGSVTEVTDQYVEILEYGLNQSYAALLPLAAMPK